LIEIKDEQSGVILSFALDADAKTFESSPIIFKEDLHSLPVPMDTIAQHRSVITLHHDNPIVSYICQA
jgi:hypothetical protein